MTGKTSPGIWPRPRHLPRRAGLSCALLLLSSLIAMTLPAAGETGKARDWSATLKGDAEAMVAFIMANHPGVYDKINPGFKAQVEAARDLALERAKTADSREAWWFAMAGLAASFNDGHVAVDMTDKDFAFSTRWPGFLTRYQGADQIVAEVAAPSGETAPSAHSALPPLGAKLISCDDVAAETLAETRIGAFEGLWFLPAQRIEEGPKLFIDYGNPWAKLPLRCRFEADGETRDYRLDWRPIAAETIADALTRLRQDIRPPFVMRALPGGGYWLSMSSFNGHEGSVPFKGLTEIIEQARDHQEALRAAPFVVLDVRGNGGGSSYWSEEIARILWGKEWIAAHPKPGNDTVDWRASKGNTALVETYAEMFRKSGSPAGLSAELEKIASGMRQSLAAGKPYWREEDKTKHPPGHAEAIKNPMAGPVYLLTNYRCASSCLTSIDLWKALQGIQIGRQTYADSLYLEAHHEVLPSGLVRATTPMKVYRDRARGSNQPQVPAFAYEGDMTDDAALLAWIRTLPMSKR
ncbi:S41 family peptidase [Fulvimarina sp. MAC3]|uniref:S41 family peptidase n=1 Tax=Fulvimarina sp. MAC3 TaxID=3148887 RepID=UPI0031FCFC14